MKFTSEKICIFVVAVYLPNNAIAINTPYVRMGGKFGTGNVVQDALGYLFHFGSKSKGGSETWLCKNRKRNKCPVSIKIDGNLILYQKREHSHKLEDVLY